MKKSNERVFALGTIPLPSYGVPPGQRFRLAETPAAPPAPKKKGPTEAFTRQRRRALQRAMMKESRGG